MTEEYVVDDRVVIPDDIKSMTKAELEAEIARLEEEARKEKMKRKQMSVAAV